MPIDPSIPDSIQPDVRTLAKISNLERRVQTLESQLQGGAVPSVPLVSALPGAGRKGRVVMLVSDFKLYADTGTAWVSQT